MSRGERAGPGSARAFLADFGLAKSVATGSKLTRTGEALGTPAYMSPEQARGEVSALAPATDVWSLGCVLFEMLGGRVAFGDTPRGVPITPAAVIAQVLTREPPRLCAVRGDVPEAVERVVRACLAKRARERYRDASALREDLDRALRGERPRARVPGSRRRTLLAGSAAAALLGAAAAWAAVAQPASPVGVAPRPATPAASAPSEAEALAARARGLRQTDPREAARLLAEALKREPAREDWRLERGVLLWAVGEWKEAREEWGRMCATPEGSPLSEAARFYRGIEAFFRLEGEGLRGDEAEPDLRAVAGGGGRWARTAEAALRAGRREWSLAREGLRGTEGWEGALLRGYVEDGDPAGDKDAAVREYRTALSEGIPFAWAHYNRGLARQAQGDIPGAIEDYERALAVAPPGWGHRRTVEDNLARARAEEARKR